MVSVARDIQMSAFTSPLWRRRPAHLEFLCRARL